MPVVVADTGPIHYLVLIGEAEILFRLFAKILIPEAVRDELLHPEAPEAVRTWAAAPPDWLDVRATPEADDADPVLTRLDRGERAALALAQAVHADLLLIDDREAVATARGMGFAVTGTLGILDLASRRGLIDLAATVARLKTTNFRYRPEILDTLLAAHTSKGEGS